MDQKIKDYLKNLLKTESGSIRSDVALELQSIDNPIEWLKSLQSSGCKSGMVSSLRKNFDIYSFFDVYCEEIAKLQEQYMEESGSNLKLYRGLVRDLVWFSFEYRANEIYNELLKIIDRK